MSAGAVHKRPLTPSWRPEAAGQHDRPPDYDMAGWCRFYAWNGRKGRYDGTCVAGAFLEAAAEIDRLNALLKTTESALNLRSVGAISELRLAERDARQLARALAAKHYSHVRQWQPLDSIRGLISQIDNMTAGLVRDSGRHAERENGEAS